MTELGKLDRMWYSVFKVGVVWNEKLDEIKDQGVLKQP